MEVFIGTILPVAFSYAPEGWASCNGQLLKIADNQALFALIGVTYGGDGTTDFALPNLQGRILLGTGTSADGVTHPMGETADIAAAPTSHPSVTRTQGHTEQYLALNYIIALQGFFPPRS
jgi:microcystin-dependent protein